MKRTRILAVLTAAILLCLMCTPVAQAGSGSGWKINTKVGSYLTKSEKKAFDKAVEQLDGVTYTPVFTLATQVVAGTNYAFFCKAKTVTQKPKNSWKIVFVYQDLSGGAKVTKIKSFDYKNIDTLAAPYSQPEGLVGGWNYNEKKITAKGIPDIPKKVFRKAAKQYPGNSLTPIALLGTREVGEDAEYKFLCRGQLSDLQGTVCLYEVIVNQNPKGDCVIRECNVINLPKYL